MVGLISYWPQPAAGLHCEGRVTCSEQAGSRWPRPPSGITEPQHQDNNTEQPHQGRAHHQADNSEVEGQEQRPSDDLSLITKSHLHRLDSSGSVTIIALSALTCKA